MEEVETLLTWNQMSAFERHPFPLLGLPCAALESIFELSHMGLEHSLVPANAVHLLAHQTLCPLRAADVLPYYECNRLYKVPFHFQPG